MQLQTVGLATKATESECKEGRVPNLRLQLGLILCRTWVLLHRGSGHLLVNKGIRHPIEYFERISVNLVTYSRLSSDLGSTYTAFTLKVCIDRIIKEHVILVMIVFGLDFAKFCLVSERE